MFIRRQLRSLERLGVQIKWFFLRSRTSPIELWREWRELRKVVGEYRPDFIHAGYGTVTSGLATLVPGVSLVVTFRGSDLNPQLSIGWVRRWLGFLISQWSAFCAKHVICVSEQLRSRLWCSKSKVTVLLDGIDLDVFYPTSQIKAREALGWNQSEKIVLFCAGNQPFTKGQPAVESAFKLVSEKIRSARLVILDGTVPPDEIPVYLNAADCLAFASLSEGSPNIVKEALACNLPVVSVDVGDVRERLNGVNPSLVVSRDVADFASGIVSVLQDGRRSNGRQTVMPHSLQAIAIRLCTLYEDILHDSLSAA